MKNNERNKSGLTTSGRTNKPEADAFLFLLWRDIRDACATKHDQPLDWLVFAHYVYVQTGERTLTLAALFHTIGGTPQKRKAAIMNLLLPPFHPTVIEEVFRICSDLDQGKGPLVDLKPPENHKQIVTQRMEEIYVFRKH